MIGAFYLGALKAGIDDGRRRRRRRPSAKAYLARCSTRAGPTYDKLLWNGEYYVQKYDKVMEKKYQYGEGCLSDQLLGQWLAMVAGLGRFLPDRPAQDDPAARSTSTTS